MSDKKKTILIVDDNADIVTTYRVVLDRMGYSVVVARNGIECLDMIDEVKPDLVILDVLLPGLSGSEVCRSIKETAKTTAIPVIAITASVSGDTRKRMSEVGADDFLLKPIDVSDLNRVIKQFL
ncbi:MAG TPA: response regulator [Candidatus Anoxymicrobiaceae bacterium]|jgi:CheY-like chemotaxis protein